MYKPSLFGIHGQLKFGRHSLWPVSSVDNGAESRAQIAVVV